VDVQPPEPDPPSTTSLLVEVDAEEAVAFEFDAVDVPPVLDEVDEVEEVVWEPDAVELSELVEAAEPDESDDPEFMARFELTPPSDRSPLPQAKEVMPASAARATAGRIDLRNSRMFMASPHHEGRSRNERGTGGAGPLAPPIGRGSARR
jgi:hypothetical protein